MTEAWWLAIGGLLIGFAVGGLFGLWVSETPKPSCQECLAWRDRVAATKKNLKDLQQGKGPS